MRTAAILPVKRFDRAKSRLGASVTERCAGGWPRRWSPTCSARSRVVTRSSCTIVVSGEPSAGAGRARARSAGRAPTPSEGGQSAAVALGVRRALDEGIERVLCVPGDCPALDARELDALLDADAAPPIASAPRVVIVPDRHGSGTNGLLLSPPDAIAPSFGPDSCERHRALALAAGVDCRWSAPLAAA